MKYQYLPPDKKVKDAPSTPAPAGATVLFSGKQEEITQHWRRNFSKEDATWPTQKGIMLVGKGDIVTKQEFTDFYLHIEFKVPYLPNNKGQQRGNSGIGLQSRYEIQVLDSSGFLSPGTGDCGSVYSQSAPLVNASKPPLSWQAYDIYFRAPRFDASGIKTEKARVTVILNGIVVQNNTEIDKPTGIGYDNKDISKPGPIYLQDHGYPVEFRNIWILSLPESGSKDYNPK
jgi:Domain of Unknown Function (DUF1080)